MRKPIDKPFDVFLSYNQTDESWLRRLKSALVAHDLTVWLACDELPGGEMFPSAIDRGMNDCAAFALVVSPESISSRWVEEEYNLARVLSNKSGAKLPIIPLLLRAAELPISLLARQFIDFRDETMFDAGVQKLLATLRPDSRLRKVCFISSEYPPSIVGGLGIHVQKLTTALAGLMDVEVVLPNPLNRTDTYQRPAENIRTVTVPVNTSYDDSDKVSWCRFATNAIQKITNWTKSERPDVIYCHDWVTVLAGIKCRWVLNIPLIFHVHLPNRAPLFRAFTYVRQKFDVSLKIVGDGDKDWLKRLSNHAYPVNADTNYM